MREWIVDDLCPDDSEALLEIARLQLGESYLSKAELLEHLEAPKHGQVILVERDPVAFSLMEHGPLEQVVANAPIELSAAQKLFNKHQHIAYRKLTAVHPQYEGQGMANALVKQGIEWLQQHTKASLLFADAWESERGIHIGKTLERHGYQALTRIENYWSTHSQEQHYQCATCKSICSCTAIIYVKELR